MRALKLCANGCGVPPQPPSKVICGACTKKIGDRLRRWAAQGYVDNDPPTPGEGRAWMSTPARITS